MKFCNYVYGRRLLNEEGRLWRFITFINAYHMPRNGNTAHEQPPHTTYLVCVKLAQRLDGQQLLSGYAPGRQRQNLQAAFLQSLDAVIKVVHGLGLVLRTDTDRLVLL